MENNNLKEKTKKVERTLSVCNLLRKKYKLVYFPEEWEEAFGRPEDHGAWYIYGRPSQGKSTFCMMLVKEFATMKMKTAYLSLEEGFGVSFQHTIRRAGWAEHSRNIVMVEKIMSVEDFDLWMEKHKRVRVIVVDSIQKWGIKKADLNRILNKYNNKLFVFISHIKSDKSPDGATAALAFREAKLKIWVEGFRAFSKGRTFGSKGYLDVWPEEAAKYYGENV